MFPKMSAFLDEHSLVDIVFHQSVRELCAVSVVIRTSNLGVGILRKNSLSGTGAPTLESL
jgi:hypothetical protein